MDKKELQQRLNQPYTTENWQEIVKFVFPNASLKSKPLVLSVLPKYKDIVETFNILGEVPLEGQKTLILLELKLKDKVNIIKNRVQLNEIVSSVIDTESANGVLSIFEKGTDDYRFSFVARSNEFSEDGDLVEKKTDAKRFTYVLGKNESCKTPANQFYELRKHKDNLIIDDVIKAFNITKLNGEFFDEYKAIYNNIVEFFTGKKLVKVGGKWEEKTTSKPDAQLTYIFKNNELEARNFVKMLLGRIVFLKFVQKKGWMGVPKTRTDWKEGNIRFLEETFENFKHKELFYSTFLSPLFFDALNNPNRKDDVFTLTDSKIPYLSGGLFDEDNLKTKEIIIPEKHFEDIFEFLDKYNFTIDENSDIDDKNEFSVDPEMLGHIFENLLEDNKDKGAFYTPKEIVRYMCQESLKEYLKTSLENNNQWPTDETEAKDFEQALHNFVTKKEAGGIIEFEETIARALKDVKICDPAIGSGAFPMGLLNEIFQLVHKLYEYNEDKVERVWGIIGWQPNIVKQNIIQNSIYGVDIEKGAVDVARLRFWLSLIVDEPEPKALPHLDYKIVVGNSLVCKLDDTIINIDWEVKEEQTDLFGVEHKELQQKLLKDISAKQKLVFDPKSDEEKLSLQIRNLKIDLLVNQLDAMVKTKGVATKPTGTSKTIKAQTELWLQTLSWKQQIEKIQKLKKQPEATLHFFDWKLDFPEIMNEQVTDKVGFDIVIANPPYVNIANISDNIFRSYIQANYKTVKNKSDLYSVFIEKAHFLSKENAKVCFIYPKTWMGSDSFSRYREFIINNYRIHNIINLGYGIFENATVSTIITVFSKQSVTANDICLFQLDRNEKGQISFIQQDNKLSYGQILSTPQYLFSFTKLVDFKIETKTLKEIVDFSLGIKTSDDNKFIIDYKKDDSTYLMLRGKNIRKYEHDRPIEYIWYKPNLMMKKVGAGPRKLEYFLYDKILIQGICNGILRCSYDSEKYLVNDKIHIAFNPKVYSLKLVLAILNSKLMSFITKSLFGNYLEIKINQLELLPFPSKIDKITEKYLVNLVNERLNCNEPAEGFKIEQQIDNLVYKLYELTYDEVLVVEPEFIERMSKVEYDSLKLE